MLRLTDSKQFFYLRPALDVVEARIHASLEVRDLLEELRELERFVALRFPMLYGCLVEIIIKFYGFIGRRAHLVLTGRAPQPEVDVPGQLAFDLCGLEDDVRVARVERAVSFSRPLFHLKVLDAPDFDARGLSCRRPGGLLLGGRLSRDLV